MYAAGHCRRRKQLWDCSQLHLPCRRGVISCPIAGSAGEIHNRAAEQQQPVRFIALHRAQQCRPADLSPELTSYAAVGVSRARLHTAPDKYLRAPCAPQQMIIQGCDRPAAPARPPAAPAPRTRLHAVCRGPSPAAEAAFGLQPAASAVSSWGNPAVLLQAAVEKYTIGQQSSSNQCDSSRCTVRSSAARSIYPRNRRAMQR